jgi:predicted PurR-regulated permease PerM
MIKAALVTLLFAVSFLVPIGSIVFLGAEAALTKIQQLQDSGMSANQISPTKAIELLGLKPILDKISELTPASEEQIRQVASRGLSAAGSWAIQALQGFLASLPGALLTLIFILITIFFLLIDGHTAVAFLKENSVFDRRQTEQIFATVSSLCYSVVVASIAAGFAQAIFVGIACGITGTHGWLLISLMTFVASFLPVVGTLPVTIFLAAHTFLQGDVHSGIVFLVFMVLVIISDNVARTFVLKGGAQLHPLVGLVAAFGALDMIGFYGVFIGPVIAGLFFAVLPLITRSYGKVPRTL